MDRAVNPGDDFFRYANGAWEKMTAIPADRSMCGIGSELAEEANAHTRMLLEAVPGAHRVPKASKGRHSRLKTLAKPPAHLSS